MVARNYNCTRGIDVMDFWWGSLAKGTREMLIQNGHAQDGPFPGDPGEKKTAIKTIDPVGRKIRIRRKSKYLFAVLRNWSDEEAAVYRAAEEVQLATALKRQEVERAKRLVASWPTSTGEFREEMRRMLEVNLRMIEILFVEGKGGGYRFDEDTNLRLKLISDQLRGLVESGTVVKDLELRERHIPDCIAETVHKADAAKQDKIFQEWMGMQGMVTK